MQKNENFAKQAEQAEAERPEVVAWQYRVTAGPQTGWSLWHPGKGEEFERSYTVERRPLMTVAQHDRIVGELRAERDGAIKLLGQSVWQKIERLTQERDAALARVAELEKQEPVATIAKVPGEDWNGLHFYRDLQGMQPGTKLYAAPVAQAQHSVPEGWMLMPVEPLLNMMSDKDHDTRITAERQLLSILAAAPGNSVPQAWLDVQAERRRQITAEGWTPEHDDEHADGQMARAAACYALAGSSAPNDGTAALLVSLAWPWDEQWWKPSTARRDMVKACALGLAEIERLDRVAASQGGPSDA
ncbi:TPA: hypothetical protein ACKROW_005241 [Pseudomonas aeruginosa]